MRVEKTDEFGTRARVGEGDYLRADGEDPVWEIYHI